MTKEELFEKKQNQFSSSGCLSCTARRVDRSCIPKAFYIKGKDTISPPVFFILGRAQEVDESFGRLFCAKEKEVFKHWISQENYPSFYVSAALRCWTEQDRLPKIEELKTCSYLHLWKELNFIQPKVVIALGEKALIGLDQKNTFEEAKQQMLKRTTYSINDINRKIKWTGSVYTVYHPAYIQMGKGRQYEEQCIKLIKEAFKENKENG